jgi:hypothetical protein
VQVEGRHVRNKNAIIFLTQFSSFIDLLFRYCERKFVDERVLVMHQKARHFKCDMCFKKLGSAIGLAVHQHQMHNKQLKGYVGLRYSFSCTFSIIFLRFFFDYILFRVPNAKSGHDSVEREIYGMDGLTPDDIGMQKLEN